MRERHVNILGRADDGRDALMAAALDAPVAALAAWHRWEQLAGDRQRDPVAERWLPLIGWNLRDAALPAGTHARFRDARYGAWASNTRLMSAARPALDALTAEGIRFVLLKGAALVLTSSDAPGLRPIGDVDVLIRIADVPTARRVLDGLGWSAFRHVNERDLLLCHGVDLVKPPHGALDVHWYLLHECCWPGADAPLWQRVRPLSSLGPSAYTLSPADQLLHICLHGLRWSPVHAGHWIADAVQVISANGADVDWRVLVEEARRREMAPQLFHALRAVVDRGHVAVPDDVLRSLESEPVSWRLRWECRLKGRPVVSAGGLFVIWSGWVRSARAARAEGSVPPRWWRYLAAAIGVPSFTALCGRFVLHAWHRIVAPPGPASRARKRPPLVDRS